MEDNLISILIPAYNVEKYIDRCLRSIISQSYKNLEIIIINDGSTDKTAEKCRKWQEKDKRIRIINEKNQGVAHARNTALDLASGAYITFVDPDDFIEPQHIEQLYKTLYLNNADISISAHSIIYPHRRIVQTVPNKSTMPPQETLHNLLYHKIDTALWGKLYKRELFNKIRCPEGRIFEDTSTTYLLIDSASTISLCQNTTYNYTIRKKSITTYKFDERKLDMITATQEMTNYLSSKYPVLKAACSRRIVFANLSTLSQLANSSTRNHNLEQQLVANIKARKGPVLKDRLTPIRDKFGILALYLGFPFYRFCWRGYLALSNKNKVGN